MSYAENEGTLAARLRQQDLPVPDNVWQRASGRADTPAPPTIGHGISTRVLVAIALAIALALAASGVIALTYLTRPAEVHRKPMSGAPGGSIAGRAEPEVQTSVSHAGQLAGFHVLTLQGVAGAQLLSTTYSPPFVPANQPEPHGGGTVQLIYSLNGSEYQINEGLDPNPSSPLSINVKVPPGYNGPVGSHVETINGGQYIFMRNLDGSINDVMWKTLDGVDISLAAEQTAATGKGNPPLVIPEDIAMTVIEHLK